MDLSWISNPEIWGSLVTLTLLEVVLGIDNLIFLSVVSEKLPEPKRRIAQRVGLLAALGMRIALLFALVWAAKLATPLFTVFTQEVSVRDLVLLAGGLFLLYKATSEIHETVEGNHETKVAGASSFFAVVVQILILDAVFSIDSIITAVGLTDQLPVMIAAVAIAIAVMMFAAAPVSAFISRHPTTRMLAMSFLVLIGAVLVADGMHFHVPRGYLYFAIGFSVFVEALNIAARRGSAPKSEKA